jgi:hypothetical protein
MFSSEHIDSSPSPKFCERLAAEKKVNVYFVPGSDNSDQQTYAYVVVSSALHDNFMEALAKGSIPDFAVIVEMGFGEPTAEVKAKIKNYYGFDHDYYANNDNFAPADTQSAVS